MKERLLRHPLAFYALRECTARPVAVVTVFLVTAVSFCILFNLYFLSYGSCLARLEQAERAYHVRLLYLTEDEVRAVGTLPYVESVRSVAREDGYAAYVRFRDPDPRLLKSGGQRIVRDLSLYRTSADERFRLIRADGFPDGWINRQYYDLAAAPHDLEILPTISLVFALSLVSVFFTLRLKAIRTQKEYGCMLAMGWPASRIARMTVFQTVWIGLASLPAALSVSIPILKIVSMFTRNAYHDSYAGVTFAIPWPGVAVLSALFLLFTSALQYWISRRLLARDVVDLIRERSRTAPPYVERSDDVIVRREPLAAYRTLYFRRSLRVRLLSLGKTLALFALPMMLLLFSISYNEGRTYSEERDFWLSPADGRITDAVVARLERIPGIESIRLGKAYAEGDYMYAEIDSQADREAECGEWIEQLAAEYGLQFTDFYQQARTLRAQADFFAPYYLIQSILMFGCALWILREDLRYELHTRRVELAVIRAIGYPAARLASLLTPYALWAAAGFLAAAVLLFLFMGLVFSIWITKPILYPFVVLACFGVLDVLIHRIRCRRTVAAMQKDEIAQVLSGKES